MNRAMVNIRLYGLVLAVVSTWDALVSVTMEQGSAGPMAAIRLHA